MRIYGNVVIDGCSLPFDKNFDLDIPSVIQHIAESDNDPKQALLEYLYNAVQLEIEVKGFNLEVK